MSTVSEQLHQYRAMKAQDTSARPAAGDLEMLVLERQHPTTSDYFRNLMTRWQKDYLKRLKATDQE